MSYEKDKLDSYLTSASLTTALAPYVTSNSLSAAIAGLDLAPYVTSNSLSAAVATDALAVRGAASVSATLSAGAVTVAGRPVGAVLLGYTAGAAVNTIGFSGSWSDFWYLQLTVFQAGVPNGFPVAQVFTDGGTTPILSIPVNATVGASVRIQYEMRIMGGDNQAVKFMNAYAYLAPGGGAIASSATATAGFVNCVRFVMTGTASVAYAALYGWRKS
jgi:hypothetical protein